MPVQAELNFWEGVLKDMKAKKEGTFKYWSKLENRWITEPISKIEDRIAKLTKRLEAIPKGGVNNYINLIYIKNAIDKKIINFYEVI